MAKLLDAREVAVPALLDSVNIPLSDLARRVHELPSRTQTVLVANVGAEAEAACRWLSEHGRMAKLTDHFGEGDFEHGRLWTPNRFLEERVLDIPIGSALDIGCGSGRDAVFLADLGWQVTAVDHLPDALCLAKDLAAGYLAPGKSIEWVCSDLDQGLDLGEFDLVICFFYLNRTILRTLPQLLIPGGHFIMETFTTIHREKVGKPKSEGLALAPGELMTLLPNLEILRLDESWRGDRHTAQFQGRLRNCL